MIVMYEYIEKINSIIKRTYVNQKIWSCIYHMQTYLLIYNAWHQSSISHTRNGEPQVQSDPRDTRQPRNLAQMTGNSYSTKGLSQNFPASYKLLNPYYPQIDYILPLDRLPNKLDITSMTNQVHQQFYLILHLAQVHHQ